ncbi:MAG: phosphoribosyl-AMP cyclohydrolase [Gammaproteobacteria bacterium]|nr:phosphoribosyl-AMP cyclohydrolase [Gammaproteobacteria bacterium]
MSTFVEFESAAAGTEYPLTAVLDALQFDAAGLLPAIAQDADSRQVLMLAWMNREALETTLREGYACYYSRSRQSLWRKGETSGHLQKLREVRFDCDGDAILLLVEQSGPACHTNRPDCFYLQVADDRVRVTAEPR